MKFSKKLTKKLLKKVKKRKKVKRFQRNQSAKKKSNSKILFIIQTPYNSNEYLIENQSTPFCEEEDKEEDLNFFPSELNNFNIGEIKDFISFSNESTNDNSNINSELIKI